MDLSFHDDEVIDCLVSYLYSLDYSVSAFSLNLHLDVYFLALCKEMISLMEKAQEKFAAELSAWDYKGDRAARVLRATIQRIYHDEDAFGPLGDILVEQLIDDGALQEAVCYNDFIREIAEDVGLFAMALITEFAKREQKRRGGEAEQ